MPKEMRVKAVRLEQRGKPLVMFPMRSDVLRRICYALPRTPDHPEEIQRQFSAKRLRDIGDFLRKPNSLLANSIVLNLLDNVRVEPTGKEEAVIIFPSDGSENPDADLYDPKGKYAYVLDGQHRILGFEYAPGVVYDLPVTALIHEDASVCAKVFADINSKQVKVGSILLEAIRLQIGDSDKEEEAAARLVRRLNSDNNSPFRELIQYPESDSKPKPPISSVTLRATIEPLLRTGGVLYEVHTENDRL